MSICLENLSLGLWMYEPQEIPTGGVRVKEGPLGLHFLKRWSASKREPALWPFGDRYLEQLARERNTNLAQATQYRNRGTSGTKSPKFLTINPQRKRQNHLPSLTPLGEPETRGGLCIGNEKKRRSFCWTGTQFTGNDFACFTCLY